MDLILFLLLLTLVLGIVYYFFMWSRFKKVLSKKIFWTLSVMTIGFALVFDGFIDRIFVFFFSIFLIFAKLVMAVFDT